MGERFAFPKVDGHRLSQLDVITRQGHHRIRGPAEPPKRRTQAPSCAMIRRFPPQGAADEGPQQRLVVEGEEADETLGVHGQGHVLGLDAQAEAPEQAQTYRFGRSRERTFCARTHHGHSTRLLRANSR